MIIITCSKCSLAQHCVMIDDSGQNGTQCYHRGELARDDLTQGEMGKGEMGKDEPERLSLSLSSPPPPPQSVR